MPTPPARTASHPHHALVLAAALAGCGGGATADLEGEPVEPAVALAEMQQSAAILLPVEGSDALPADDETVTKALNCNAHYCEESFTRSARTAYGLDDFVCVLSHVYGDYGSEGHAGVTAGQTHWEVAGKGRMICAPRSKYRVPSGSWIGASQAFCQFAPKHSTVNAWWGDAITFVSDIWGELEGRDFQAYIEQSGYVDRPSVLHVTAPAASFPNTNLMSGCYTSIFAGKPVNQLVRLWGYDTNDLWATGNARSSGTFEFSVSVPNGYSTFYLGPTSDMLCGFTRIAGDLDDGDEQVRILAHQGSAGEVWKLIARESGPSSAAAKARCQLYDQR